MRFRDGTAAITLVRKRGDVDADFFCLGTPAFRDNLAATTNDIKYSTSALTRIEGSSV